MDRKFWRRLIGKRTSRCSTVAELRVQASGILADLRETLSAENPSSSLHTTIASLESCAETISQSAANSKVALARIEQKRASAADAYRLVQVSYRTIRKPRRPDLLKTAILVMAFWILETVAAAAVLSAEGSLDAPAAIGFAASFAAINILTGVATGFLPLRYLSYCEPHDVFADGEEKSRAAVVIRGFALVGTVAGLTAEALLIFSAARLRASGSHSVWDFSEVGLWETYSDSLAIMITVIGVCSATFAIREGFCGIADPIPGYGEAYSEATSEISDAADDLAENAIESIYDVSDDALDRAERTVGDATEIPELVIKKLLKTQFSIDIHNSAVRDAKDKAIIAHRKKQAANGFIVGRPSNYGNSIDQTVFDDLILPNVDDRIAEYRSIRSADIAPVRDAIARLEETRANMISEVRANLAGFHAASPNLDALFDAGGDHGTS